MENFWYIHKLSNNHHLYRYSKRCSLGCSKLIIDDIDNFIIQPHRFETFYIDKRKIKSVKTYDIREWNVHHEGLGYYNLEHLNLIAEITFTDYFYSLVFLHNLPELNKVMPYPSGLITEYRFEE